MGGKASAPPAPDYVGATQLQGQISKENLNMQNYANRPVINTPFGTQSWGTQNVVDPSTGQNVTQWTQNTTLAPGLQAALNDQVAIQRGRSELAGNAMDQVASDMHNSFDWAGLPNPQSANAPGSLQDTLTDYTPGLSTDVNSRSGQISNGFDFTGPQASLNTQGVAALPQFDSNYRDQVANTLMQRMVPIQERQQQQLQTQLANQGFHQGSEAYKRALDELNMRQSAERYNALDTAGNEAQRLYNMQMGTATQGFNQALQGGQFANQAQNQFYNQMMGQANLNNQAQQQAFGQDLAANQFQNQALGQASGLDLARMQAQNQAMAQQYGLNQQYADAQNRLRQQAISEQQLRRGQSLNELNALLSGQQVAMPNMPTFVASGRAETPDILGATQMGYNAQLGAVNAQNAANAGMMSGLFSLGSAAAPFIFSDRRLKSNITRIGTHPIGVGIYEYTMMGMPQRGVIAQELQKVRPDLVKRHANGYLMVNYGGL